jgi:hypothetical protein
MIVIENGAILVIEKQHFLDRKTAFTSRPRIRNLARVRLDASLEQRRTIESGLTTGSMTVITKTLFSLFTSQLTILNLA